MNKPVTMSFVCDHSVRERLEAEAKFQGGRSISSLLRTIILEWMDSIDAQRQAAGEDVLVWRPYVAVVEEIEI